MYFLGRRKAPNTWHGGKMLAPHFKDEIVGLQKWLFLAGFWPFLCSFLLWLKFMGKPCTFCNKKIVPRCLFLAAGRLKTLDTAVKCLLLISRMRLPAWEMAVLSRFVSFLGAVFLLWLIFMGKPIAFCKKKCPQMSFPGCREAPNILHPPFEGSPPPTQLTNVSHKSQLSRAINKGGPCPNFLAWLQEVYFWGGGILFLLFLKMPIIWTLNW